MRFLLTLLFASSLFAQGDNFAAFGISANPGASPAIAGTGMYAKRVSGNTFSFAVVDTLPTLVKPYTVNTQYSGGIAQKIASIKGIDIYVPASAGLTSSGSNTGWNWNTGALASIRIKGSWFIFPNARVTKSSIVNQYQVIGGILVGWGW